MLAVLSCAGSLGGSAGSSGRVLFGLFVFFPHPCPSRVLRRQRVSPSPSALGRGAGVGFLGVTPCLGSAQRGDAAGGWGPGEAEGTEGQR